MKRAFLILAVLACTTAAFAADAAKGTKAGGKALLFSASGFDAGNFGGQYAIGAKYYIAGGLALRPVLKFGYGSQTDKITPGAADSGNAGGGNVWHRTFDDTKSSSVNFGLDLGLEKSVLAKGSADVHVGGVAGFTLGSYSRDSAENYTLTNAGVPQAGTEKISWKQKRTTSAFNLAALLGAEWFVTDNIILGGEYQFGLSIGSTGKDETAYSDAIYNGATTTSTSYTITNPKVSTTAIGFSTVGLVLGIRF